MFFLVALAFAFERQSFIFIMTAMFDPISTASTLVDAATLAYNGKRNLRYLFNTLRKRVTVLVYGDSGVGKTQFLLTLTGNDNYWAPARTRQIQHVDFVLRSGRRIRFIDTPGHASNMKSREEGLDNITRGGIDGIINLVDYGYQDSEQVQANLDKVFQNGTTKVKQEYLRDNQKLEIERTKEIIGRINSKSRVKWFITIINKADIWNNERTAVINYYEEGEYKLAMENLEHAVSVTVCPFCSVITPFGNQAMQLTYSERDKRLDYANLINTLEEFIQGSHE